VSWVNFRSSRRRSRKPAKPRKADPEMALNALLMMLLVLIALGGSYLYDYAKAPAGTIAAPMVSALENK
jgi:hypothetical protein